MKKSLYAESQKSHELARCLVTETNIYGGGLNWERDFTHCDEICHQLHFDEMGHGINGRPKSYP